MNPTLLKFVQEHLGESTGLGRPPKVIDDHRYRLSRIVDQPLPYWLRDLVDEAKDNPSLLLNVVDYVVHYCQLKPSRLPQLQVALEEGRSAYVVGVDSGGHLELQHRQPPELTELMNETLSGRDEVARQLAAAWSGAFGRTPDLKAACDAAVVAVEEAAKPVVIPNDQRATLGLIIKALEDKPEKWTTVTGSDRDIDSVIGMLRLVWTGFTRHGGDPSPIPLTPELAQMIVHTAVLLVHWFQSGSVRRMTA
ncbi:hypothetical protein [Candidatus Poriferisodalis sp.]|uniref:hypothetical protein n=1 Tax=Candidatus Poriferisodalis sp. TaxID=3101277 RepID=UPI003AF514C8